jgi:hypothetical protein
MLVMAPALDGRHRRSERNRPLIIEANLVLQLPTPAR